MKRKFSQFSLLAVSLLFLAHCSANKNALNSNVSGFSCTAVGTVASNALSTTFQVSNLTVNLLNAGIGPFTITIPGITPVNTSSLNYIFPGSFYVTSSAYVTVLDKANSATTTCAIESSSNSSTTNSNINVQANPGLNAAVGAQINLTASDSAYPNATFTFASNNSSVSVTSTGGTTARLTSSVAASAIITVTESGTGATKTVSVSFGSAQPTSLNCFMLRVTPQLNQPMPTSQPAAVNEYIYFMGYSSEPLIVTSFNPNEPVLTPQVPNVTGYFPFRIRYASTGTKNLKVWAKGAQSGIPCNNGAAMSATLQIQ